MSFSVSADRYSTATTCPWKIKSEDCEILAIFWSRFLYLDNADDMVVIGRRSKMGIASGGRAEASFA